MLPRLGSRLRASHSPQKWLPLGTKPFHTGNRQSSQLHRFKRPKETPENQLLRRTFFYVPASNPRFIEKALQSKADCIVLDLEDGVAPHERDKARGNVLNTLKRLRTEGHRPGENKKAELCLRINHMGWQATDWGGFTTDIRPPSQDLKEDLDLLAQPEAKDLTIVVPKTHSYGNLEAIRKVLFNIRNLDHRTANEHEEYKMIPIIESGQGVMEANEIARWRRLVVAMVFGAEDYCEALDIPRTSDWTNINYARSAIVNACRANNIVPIDFVCQDYKNNDILQKECENGVYMGFQGKQCVHPDQIETIHQTFSPQIEEVEWANRVLAAQKANNFKGAIEFEGKMIDAPVFKKAERVKSRYNKIKTHEDSKFYWP